MRWGFPAFTENVAEYIEEDNGDLEKCARRLYLYALLHRRIAADSVDVTAEVERPDVRLMEEANKIKREGQDL